MTRIQKMIVGSLALVVAWVLIVLLDLLFAPAYWQVPAGATRGDALVFFFERGVLFPLVTLLLWPAGWWLWRAGRAAASQYRLGKGALYALALATWALALVLLGGTLKTWFIH